MRVEDLVNPLVDGDAGADGKDQDRDDKGPEIELDAIAEGVLLVGGLPGLFQPVQQETLVARVDQRVDALRHHGGGAGPCGGNELGDGNEEVADERGVNDFLGAGGGHERVPGLCV